MMPSILGCLLWILAFNADANMSSGVTIRIWDIGSSMHDIHPVEPGQLPNVVKVIPSLDLEGSSDFLGYSEHFVLLADGSIVINEPGVYEFRLTSDDGSELWIAGQQVVDHGGLHSASAVDGTIVLDIGTHPFQVKFFQDMGDAVLRLEWKTPMAARFQVVPETVLRTALSEEMPTSRGYKSVVRPGLPKYPGHGVSLSGVHPVLEYNSHPLGELDGIVTGMDWAEDDQLLLLTDAGSLWSVEMPKRRYDDPKLSRIAAGMDDPGGLVAAADGIWVIQREELTRLRDLNGDGQIDEYQAVATGWPMAGSDAGTARGLIEFGDRFLSMLTRMLDDQGRPVGSEHRGTLLEISRDGSWEIMATGLVSPEGFVHGDETRIAVIDQAAFGGVVPLLIEGHSIVRDGVQIPGWESKPTAGVWIKSSPWEGQVLVVGHDGHGMRRIQFDQHDSGVQGTVFRASQWGSGDHVDHMAVDHEDRIWLVTRGESGVHLHQAETIGSPVFEMESIETFSNGIGVTFTQPFDAMFAGNPSSWRVGAKKLSDLRGQAFDIEIDRVTLAIDGRTAYLESDDLEDESMIHVGLVGPWSSLLGDKLYSNEAWYTMHKVPTRRLPTSSVHQHVPNHNTLTTRQQAEGWELLFDGQTMDSWRGFNKEEVPEGWSIIDGSIVRTGQGGDIITREQFDDFELSLDWQVASGGNSGIFYNVTEDGHSVWLTGPEMQVLDNAKHADGKNPLTSAGSNYALHAPSFDMTGPPGSWNRAKIVVRGDHVEHWLNGVRVVEYVLQSPAWERRVSDSKFKDMPDYGRRPRGHIALQDHGDFVAFRNIMIRPLATVTQEEGP
ncbi:MAG: DUF1080 domain-containing protein [Phycisphaerales bacterium]|nr:DUF1080 domain-containing protein [Phycisphaerales bacterium]